MAQEILETDKQKFKVLLNTQADLEAKLEEFRIASESVPKPGRKKCKRRYYQMGLMAKVISSTTDEELQRLLKHGTRIFSIDLVVMRRDEIEMLIMRLDQAITNQQCQDPYVKISTGLCMEILGDSCRVGRMRNDVPIMLKAGDVLTLSTEHTYRYCGYKQIVYVLNLNYYLSALQVRYEITIGSELHCRIVKKLEKNVAVLVLSTGLLNSYDYIDFPSQCYTLKQQVLPQLYKEDLEQAVEWTANFIVCPRIRCKSFLKALRNSLTQEKFGFKLIGQIDFEFVSSKMLDVMGLIKLLDYVWMPDLFRATNDMEQYIKQDVIPICKSLKKPIIGSVPIERCSDFKCYENHELLWKIDAICMEKSQWCKRYPLIVKKLLPVVDFTCGVVENVRVLKDMLDNFQSIVNFIIRTICTIECEAVLVYSTCESAAFALARPEIYCPVYVMLPLDDPELASCRLNLARELNLRRNVRGLLYTKEQNECGFGPIQFGVDYLKRTGCLKTGDFVLGIEVGKEDANSVQFGVGEDVVNLTGFFIPPPKIGERFVYGQPLPCQNIPRTPNFGLGKSTFSI